MKKLWQRSEILFAVAFIAVYVVANSLLDEASRGLDVDGAERLHPPRIPAQGLRPGDHADAA